MQHTNSVPLLAATNRLLTAGYQTNFDLASLLFVFNEDSKHVISLPVVRGRVCNRCLQALEYNAKMEGVQRVADA